MNRQSKIQSMVVQHLIRHGTLDIVLPDGILLEIGIVTTDKDGNKVKSDDYCYVSAERGGRRTLLDSYNAGLTYQEDSESLLFEEQAISSSGEILRCVEVV